MATKNETTRPLIDLHNVSKIYTGAAGRFVALENINLQVNKGEFVTVIGKSGSGKSTLVNMITGIDRPTSGEVWVNGTLVNELGEGKTAVWRGRHIGLIFQFFQLLPTLSVIENVMLPMDFAGRYGMAERMKRAMNLLDQLDLAGHAHKLPSFISGGEQQRVAIARALANDPPLILADEPTGNLDSKTAANVITLFESLRATGKTLLIVTHDRDVSNQASRIITLADGRIVDERYRVGNKLEAGAVADDWTYA